jgi:hypothetical protein
VEDEGDEVVAVVIGLLVLVGQRARAVFVVVVLWRCYLEK